MANLNSPALNSIYQFVYRKTPSAIWRTRKNETAMLSQPTRRSACQFVYRGIVGGVCIAQNNRGPIFSPQAPETRSKKIVKYEIHTGSLRDNKSVMFSQPGREPPIKKRG